MEVYSWEKKHHPRWAPHFCKTSKFWSKLDLKTSRFEYFCNTLSDPNLSESASIFIKNQARLLLMVIFSPFITLMISTHSCDLTMEIMFCGGWLQYVTTTGSRWNDKIFTRCRNWDQLAAVDWTPGGDLKITSCWYGGFTTAWRNVVVGLPSGNLLHGYWSHGPVEIVDLPTSMVIFNSYVNVYLRVYPLTSLFFVD